MFAILLSHQTGVERGAYCAARAANLPIGDGGAARASCLVIAVPNAARWTEWPGLAAVHRDAIARALPIEIVDESTDLEAVHARMKSRAAHDILRLHVTGPRDTHWSAGARLGFRFVIGLVPTDELWIGSAARSLAC